MICFTFHSSLLTRMRRWFNYSKKNFIQWKSNFRYSTEFSSSFVGYLGAWNCVLILDTKYHSGWLSDAFFFSWFNWLNWIDSIFIFHAYWLHLLFNDETMSYMRILNHEKWELTAEWYREMWNGNWIVNSREKIRNQKKKFDCFVAREKFCVDVSLSLLTVLSIFWRFVMKNLTIRMILVDVFISVFVSVYSRLE